MDLFGDNDYLSYFPDENLNLFGVVDFDMDISAIQWPQLEFDEALAPWPVGTSQSSHESSHDPTINLDDINTIFTDVFPASETPSFQPELRGISSQTLHADHTLEVINDACITAQKKRPSKTDNIKNS